MDIEDLTRKKVFGGTHLVSCEDSLVELPEQFIIDLLECTNKFYSKELFFRSSFNTLVSRYKLNKIPRMSSVNYTMRMMVSRGKLTPEDYEKLVKYTLTKGMRGGSGIFQVAVMLNGHEMDGCDFDCYYCPKQKGMPRSYVREGPSARRAEQWNQECIGQIHARLTSYSICGHIPDKIEIIVLGGTWSSFPMEYRRRFITEVFYSANTFYDDKKNLRPMRSLSDEQFINTTSLIKIIGLTIETRPDCITTDEIFSMLELGVTRVQIGVQHTDNSILTKINRQCSIEQAKAGIKMLKNSGFKIVCHYMPNLPFSSPQKDTEMLETVMDDPDLDCDDLKIYPTMVTTTSTRDTDEVLTVIEKWYKEGKYVPYSEEELKEVLIHFKTHPNLYTKRISRLFRDIPKHNTISGCENPHMREIIKKEMQKRELTCVCIRCREIRNRFVDSSKNYVNIEKRNCSEGTEVFIEYINGDYILGFVRLRLPYKNFNSFTAMPGYAFIRELHVYSNVYPTNISNLPERLTKQHRGYGSLLLKEAEKYALKEGYKKIAVISGVGVRNYYRKKHGYTLKNHYMVKTLKKPIITIKNTMIVFLVYIIAKIIFKLLTIIV